MKQKVAIVDNSMGITGAFKAILNYADFAKDQYDFTFFIPRDSKTTNILQKEGFTFCELPFLEISKQLKKLFLYPFLLSRNSIKFKKETSKLGIKLVHINDYYNLVPVVAKIFGAKYKIITHVRFMPDRFPKILQKLWITLHKYYSEYIICVSEAVKSKLKPHKKIIKIYDHLPLYLNSLNNVQSKQVINLLYLAHYIPGKGQDLAIEAFDLAYKTNKMLRLEFVGGDLGLLKNADFKKHLIYTAQKKSLEQVVSFSSEIVDTQEKMINSDIFLNFSESESFSMTTLEALSLGIPVIVSNSGGPSELFEHGNSGFLVANKNIHHMATAILQLSDDHVLRTKFSINSVKYVKEKFSIKNTFIRLKELYNQTVEDAIH